MFYKDVIKRDALKASGFEKNALGSVYLYLSLEQRKKISRWFSNIYGSQSFHDQVMAGEFRSDV